MKTRVKVKRAELIKIVDGRLRKAEKEHDRAKAAYPGKVEAWEKAVVAKLERVLADAKRGKMPTDHYGRHVNLPDRPAAPSEGRATCNLRRMLTTLRMGADATLLLSQEDADEYFGPCTR